MLHIYISFGRYSSKVFIFFSKINEKIRTKECNRLAKYHLCPMSVYTDRHNQEKSTWKYRIATAMMKLMIFDITERLQLYGTIPIKIPELLFIWSAQRTSARNHIISQMFFAFSRSVELTQTWLGFSFYCQIIKMG